MVPRWFRRSLVSDWRDASQQPQVSLYSCADITLSDVYKPTIRQVIVVDTIRTLAARRTCGDPTRVTGTG